MEDTLRDEKETRKSFGIFNVLILVLMEDTLRVWVITLLTEINMVLILVLMEDTLRVGQTVTFKGGRSLNPCFNGRYSQRQHAAGSTPGAPSSLNPCFNGRYSQSYQ